MSLAQAACLAALSALLLRAGWSDARTRIISNRLNLAVALLAVPWWWAIGLDPWPGIATQLALGLGTFLLFALLFACNMIGGGDVKLVAALGLWLPAGEMLVMLWAMALVGGILAAGMLAHRRLAPAPVGGAPRPAAEVPYGIAIVIGAIPFIANRILTMVGA